MKLIRIKFISSRADSFGNTYHAMEVENLITGKELQFTISGDNGASGAYDLFGNWEAVREFADCSDYVTGYRDFAKTVKGWKHAGCTGKEIAKYIIDNGGLPTFWEAISAFCMENGIEIGSHESDLYVPESPAITRLLDAYGKRGSLREIFINQITGKLSYCVPFAYAPYWEARSKTRTIES